MTAKMWDEELGLFRSTHETPLYDWRVDGLRGAPHAPIEARDGDSSEAAPQDGAATQGVPTEGVPTEGALVEETSPEASHWNEELEVWADAYPGAEDEDEDPGVEQASFDELVAMFGDSALFEDDEDAEPWEDELPRQGKLDKEDRVRQEAAALGHELGRCAPEELDQLEHLLWDSGNRTMTARALRRHVRWGHTLEELVQAHALRQAWRELTGHAPRWSTGALSWAGALRLLDTWAGVPDAQEVAHALEVLWEAWCADERPRRRRWWGATQFDGERHDSHGVFACYVEACLGDAPSHWDPRDWAETALSDAPVACAPQVRYTSRPDRVSLHAQPWLLANL